MDLNSGRKKHVTGSGKGVSKRGTGLGTGPVGRSDGYSGRTGSTGSQGTPSGGYSNSGQRPGGTRPTGQRPTGQRPVGSGSGGQRPTGGFGLNPKLLLVVVVIIIIFAVAGRGCFSGGSQSSGAYTPQQTAQTAQTQQQTQQTTQTVPTAQPSQSAQTAQSGYGGTDLYSLLSGFSGNHVSEGWSMAQSNTASLNTEVAPEAREKRTNILGNGQDTITIMLYMCGTDLESKSGMASRDIQEICTADLSDKINLLIYTGGCRSWKINGISTSVNQIYKAEKGGIRQIVSDAGSGAMTDPNTLTAFIKWCAENYPANRNDLILWDHGGGSISGYGYDEKNQYAGSMTLSGINKALANAGVTFDFIGFDTCLMATLENALVCSKYADYLVASEETEPGTGWYYTKWLNSLSANTSEPTLTTGKNIIDGFVDECARSCAGQKATLSLTDLSELQATVPEKFSAFSENTANLIKGDNYKTVSDARAGAREFAASSRIDQIDLVDFAEAVGTNEAQELCNVLLDAIKYNRTSSNMTNSYGLSIYFPYSRTSKVNSITSIYKEIGMDEEYSRCIQSFAGVETGGQLGSGGYYSPISSLLGGSYGSYGGSGGMTVGSDALESLLSSFLSGGRSIGDIDPSDAGYMSDKSVFDAGSAAEYIAKNQFDPSALTWKQQSDGTILLQMSPDKWNLIQSLQMNMFYDDGSGYVDLGLDNIYEFTEDGYLKADIEGTWISINEQPVAYYYESTIKENGVTTITGRVPALLNGERVNLIIVFEDDNYGRIAGAAYDYINGETETVPKTMTELNEGDKIEFLCDYYSYSGEYQDSYKLGEPVTYSSDLMISDTYVGGKVVITYLLTDIYAAEYWTQAIALQ